MKFAFKALVLAAAALVGSAQAASVVWDQGPSTGSVGGSWSNTTNGQNFADSVQFASTTVVTGLNYFTDFDLSSDSGSAAFHLKVFADASGVPGSSLVSQDLGYSSVAALGNGVNELQFNFSGLSFSAGQTYWVGLSGNGFEAAQLSVHSPQNGHMAQFNGGSYRAMTGVGDQMFQLTSGVSAVPETSNLALLGAGLALVGFMARRRQRA